MKSNVKNQEIIISGISGSGKTEVAKLILTYVVNACNNFKFLDAGEFQKEGLFDDQLSEDSQNDIENGPIDI